MRIKIKKRLVLERSMMLVKNRVRIVLKVVICISLFIFVNHLQAAWPVGFLQSKKRKQPEKEKLIPPLVKQVANPMTAKELGAAILQKEDRPFFATLLAMKKNPEWAVAQYEACSQMNKNFKIILRSPTPLTYGAITDPGIPFSVLYACRSVLIKNHIDSDWVSFKIAKIKNKPLHASLETDYLYSEKLFGKNIYPVVDEFKNFSLLMTFDPDKLNYLAKNPKITKALALHEAMHLLYHLMQKDGVLNKLLQLSPFDDQHPDFVAAKKTLHKQQEITADEFPAKNDATTAKLLYNYFREQEVTRRENQDPIDSSCFQDPGISAARARLMFEAHRNDFLLHYNNPPA